MADAITARVFRYDPDQDAEPRFQEYSVTVDDDTSVLVSSTGSSRRWMRR